MTSPLHQCTLNLVLWTFFLLLIHDKNMFLIISMYIGLCTLYHLLWSKHGIGLHMYFGPFNTCFFVINRSRSIDISMCFVWALSYIWIKLMEFMNYDQTIYFMFDIFSCFSNNHFSFSFVFDTLYHVLWTSGVPSLPWATGPCELLNSTA